MAFLCAGTRACLTTDAIFTICNGHHFVAHVIAEFVLTLKGFFDKLQDSPAADLIASPAADALFNVDRFNELRCPCLSAPRLSDNAHGSLLFRHQVKV